MYKRAKKLLHLENPPAWSWIWSKQSLLKHYTGHARILKLYSWGFFYDQTYGIGQKIAAQKIAELENRTPGDPI